MATLKVKQQRSEVTAEVAIAFLTANDEKKIIEFLSKFPNIEHRADKFGRTLLHIAASQGKNEVIRWLCSKGVNLLARDRESNWTALHRAAFYGHLGTINLIIELGREASKGESSGVRCPSMDSLLNARDFDRHTYLDILIEDRKEVYNLPDGKNFYETFTWGTNPNNTMGHIKGHSATLPERVDFFWKAKISIVMVSMSTYHTIFLSSDGAVYTCGHGLGGRLGHGDEKSVLEPKLVHQLPRVGGGCMFVSATPSQSFFLDHSGVLHCTGLNTHQLLAQSSNVDKLLSPKPMGFKVAKPETITGIWGQRYHVAVCTNRYLYTYGLNAGQLGHPKISNEKLIGQPRRVNHLAFKTAYVELVATSEAATVVTTVKGDVFLLHDYECKRIMSK